MPAIPWVIVPTFNEAENIEAIVAAIRSVLLETAPEGFHIVVVDDSSPDGTGRLADRLAAGHEEVEVIHRKRREGLGPAYLAGFDRALVGGAAYVIEMDADFSHDPKDLPRPGKVRAGDADLALGSRYVPGGVEEASCAGSSAAAAPGTPDSCSASGSRPDRRLPCFRREVLRGIDLPTVRTKGPGRADLPRADGGYRVVELPIVQQACVEDVAADRRRGDLVDAPARQRRATRGG